MTTSTSLSPRASALLDSLSPEQREAATSSSRRLFVQACAGSGKTRTIVARVVHLLETRGLPTGSVLALCFTRAAAAELRRRVVEIVGDDLATILECHTIHGWALRVLRQVTSRVMLPGEFQVATEEEAADALVGIFKGPEARPESKATSMRRVGAALSRLDALGHGEPSDDQATRSVLSTWHARLILRGLATHGMVLREVAALIEARDPETMTLFDRYAHVLVDECQDTTALELRVVRAIGAEETYAGDLAQAIYGWRHAEGWRVLQQDESAAILPLARSYRFGSVLAGHANGILPSGRYGPAIEGSGDPSGVVLRMDRSALKAYVADAIGRHGPSGVAVLCRTHFEAEAAVSEIGSSVATHVQRREPVALRAALAIARLAIRPGDEASFRALWRLDGGTVAGLHGLISRAGHARGLYAQWLRDSAPDSGSRWLLAPSGMGPETPWGSCVALCASLEGSEDLARLSAGLEAKALPEALDALSERTEADDFARAAAAGLVPVSTVHGFKGREAAAVVVLTVPGWPPSADGATDARTEEERRVFYVACTRARRELALLHDDRFPGERR